MRPQRRFGIALSVIALWFTILGVASADNGTAHNGPHNVPGTIRAIDFNDGPSLIAYYATTPGNQGGYSGYRPDTDVDIAAGPGGPYVIASRADAFNHDWLKYSVEVSQPGWYRVDYFARVIAPAPSVDLVTLIDDRQLGYTQGVPVQDDFADVWSRSLYLGTGRHTLGILFLSPAVALDRIEISTAPAPLALKPRIMPVLGPRSEVVVADAVVTDPPFLADPTGVLDSTQAFIDAIAAVAISGGGTVFAPAGIYRIDGTLFIPESTTLRGVDLIDRSDPNRIGTLLLASAGEGDETAASFISLDGSACVRDLSIWYPSQGFTTDTVRSFPFTVSIAGCCANILNLRLYNSYDGVAIHGGDTNVVDIVGTVLHQGLVAGNGFEFAWLSNVHFGNDIWESAPHAVISNAPASVVDRLSLDTYTSSHLTGFQFGENDGYSVYDLRVRNAWRDVVIKRVPGDFAPIWGVLSKIDGRIEEVEPFLDQHFLNTDLVPGAEGLSYDSVGFRSPANTTNFASVSDQPFGASGDGRADDTAAIQAALDTIGRQGGGTVFLPQGQYRVTRLVVPSGVELRGPLGGGIHSSTFAVCTILGYSGKNTSAPGSDPALLTLSPGSGVRGFDVVYPEQGYGSAGAPVLPFPFTIRGTGGGVWVENVTVANAYNLIDFASLRCDDHFISGVQATILNTGILIGGGSLGGRVEKVLISRGVLYGYQGLSGPHGYGAEALAAYMRENALPFVFGRCIRETTFGLDAFEPKIGWQMLAVEGGCTDSTYWHTIFDTPFQTAFLFEGGNNLRFVGEGEACNGTAFVSSVSFTGLVDFLGTTSGGGSKYKDLSGGTFGFHNERSLTFGKTATASSSAFADEGPSAAIDGSEFTKWVSAAGGTNWLTVDLDQPSEIDRWVARHAGISGMPEELNTNTFVLQVSDDGLGFSNVAVVADNGYRLTDRPVAGRGRFVRLLVTRGTQEGEDGRARIYEFEAHGKEGWEFATDAEGWAPLPGVSSFATSDGKLDVSSLGALPTIASPDNLNIATSKFSFLRVRMRNAGGPTSANVFFVTQADPAFNEAKSTTLGRIESSRSIRTITSISPALQGGQALSGSFGWFPFRVPAMSASTRSPSWTPTRTAET